MTDQIKEYKLAREGQHVAVLSRIIRAGVHTIPGYQGAPAEDKPQICLAYELLDEWRDDEKKEPYMYRTFGLVGNFNEFYSEKGKLTKMMSTAFSDYKQGDKQLQKYLGQHCILNVVHRAGKGKHEGKTFDNLGSLSVFPDFAPKPEEQPVFEPVFFDFDNPSKESWDKLTKYEQEFIQDAKNYPGSKLANLLGDTGVDDDAGY